MSEIEQHPFGYFLPENAEILIIGSFPCKTKNGYGDWFYSGSGKNDFWKLLSEVYGMQVETKIQKMEICKRYRIAITDIALSILRLEGNCYDSNLKIIDYNINAIDRCLVPSIMSILFTSKFVEKHFLKNYPNINKHNVTLPSPSPSARKFIAGLEDYKKLKESDPNFSTYQYRLMKYRHYLNNDKR